jgi:hypothetical protein
MGNRAERVLVSSCGLIAPIQAWPVAERTAAIVPTVGGNSLHQQPFDVKSLQNLSVLVIVFMMCYRCVFIVKNHMNAKEL